MGQCTSTRKNKIAPSIVDHNQQIFHDEKKTTIRPMASVDSYHLPFGIWDCLITWHSTMCHFYGSRHMVSMLPESFWDIEPVLKQVLKQGRIRRFRRGEIIYDYFDEIDKITLVIDGLINIYTTYDNNDTHRQRSCRKDDAPDEPGMSPSDLLIGRLSKFDVIGGLLARSILYSRNTPNTSKQHRSILFSATRFVSCTDMTTVIEFEYGKLNDITRMSCLAIAHTMLDWIVWICSHAYSVWAIRDKGESEFEHVVEKSKIEIDLITATMVTKKIESVYDKRHIDNHIHSNVVLDLIFDHFATFDSNVIDASNVTFLRPYLKSNNQTKTNSIIKTSGKNYYYWYDEKTNNKMKNILRYFRIRIYKPGRVLYREGEPSSSTLFYLYRGRVEASWCQDYDSVTPLILTSRVPSHTGGQDNNDTLEGSHCDLDDGIPHEPADALPCKAVPAASVFIMKSPKSEVSPLQLDAVDDTKDSKDVHNDTSIVVKSKTSRYHYRNHDLLPIIVGHKSFTNDSHVKSSPISSTIVVVKEEKKIDRDHIKIHADFTRFYEEGSFLGQVELAFMIPRTETITVCKGKEDIPALLLEINQENLVDLIHSHPDIDLDTTTQLTHFGRDAGILDTESIGDEPMSSPDREPVSPRHRFLQKLFGDTLITRQYEFRHLSTHTAILDQLYEYCKSVKSGSLFKFWSAIYEYNVDVNGFHDEEEKGTLIDPMLCADSADSADGTDTAYVVIINKEKTRANCLVRARRILQAFVYDDMISFDSYPLTDTTRLYLKTATVLHTRMFHLAERELSHYIATTLFPHFIQSPFFRLVVDSTMQYWEDRVEEAQSHRKL